MVALICEYTKKTIELYTFNGWIVIWYGNYLNKSLNWKSHRTLYLKMAKMIKIFKKSVADCTKKKRGGGGETSQGGHPRSPVVCVPSTRAGLPAASLFLLQTSFSSLPGETRSPLISFQCTALVPTVGGALSWLLPPSQNPDSDTPRIELAKQKFPSMSYCSHWLMQILGQT